MSEPDQIDMMDEHELRDELRSALTRLQQYESQREVDASMEQRNLEDTAAKLIAERDAALLKLDSCRKELEAAYEREHPAHNRCVSLHEHQALQFQKRVEDSQEEARELRSQLVSALDDSIKLERRLQACRTVLEWGRPFDGDSEFFKRMDDALAVETDQSGPCGAFISNDPHSYCRLENDHDGEHEFVSRAVEKHAPSPTCLECGETLPAAMPGDRHPECL